MVTFHIMGISRTTIILGHMWLMEHNPKIDWCTGEIDANAMQTENYRGGKSAKLCIVDMTRKQLKTHLHR